MRRGEDRVELSTYLRRIDMSKSMHAYTLATVVSLPIPMTDTHVIACALAVAITGVGTLSIHRREVAESADQNHQNMIHN